MMKRHYHFLLIVLCLNSCALLDPNPNRKGAQASKLELTPFTTDYCSNWPDGTKKNPKLWANCCFSHDLHYWVGGTENDRVEADHELKDCVKDTGADGAAFLMYIGVRLGGTPGAASYSWGYGWTQDRNYSKLEKADIERATSFLDISLYNQEEEGRNLIGKFKKYLTKKD